MGIVQLPPTVRNLVNAARATVGEVVEAMTPATKDARAERLAICRACPNYRNTSYEHCALCSCPFTSRNFLQRAHCPDNPPRW